jgi:hypothetical protein
MNELVTVRPAGADVEAYRASTEAAEICKGIVLATSSNIQGKRYVSVEGWQAIAVAHGCAAGARDVEKVDGGVRAIGEVRRMSDGQLIAVAEGFVGEDEPTWYGGKSRGRDLPKRADYAIRAMAQTRAISRACRSAFAHVVVMMNAGLATTPAEEVPYEGFGNDPPHNPQTGEVGERIETHEPAAREKLDGPHTSKTALKAAITKVVRAIEKCETLEAIDKVKTDNKRSINQARRDWPELIDGDPNCAEDIGLKGTIEKRRAELSVSTAYRFLASIVQECPTKADLESLLDEYASKIEELDGEESRLFELAYNNREIALAKPEPMTTGAFGG